MATHHQLLTINTQSGIHISDITAQLHQIISDSKINNGIVAISSMHTTMALTINEAEERLLVDINNYFSQLAPATNHYLHNDLHLRDVPEDEPENAHSHIIAMIIGNSETLAVVDGKPILGTYQSLMAVELDGPRHRRLSIQVVGE